MDTDAGDRGIVGKQSEDATAGDQGIDGKQSEDATAWDQGTDGNQSEDATAGNQGIDGKQSEDATAGDQGIDGKQSEKATGLYQIDKTGTLPAFQHWGMHTADGTSYSMKYARASAVVLLCCIYILSSSRSRGLFTHNL